MNAEDEPDFPTPDDMKPDRLVIGHVETSPTIGKIATALAKAQAAFGKVVKAESANVKNQAGTFLYKYTYATLADSIDAVTKALTDNEIAVIQPVASSRGTITVTTILAHSSGEWMSSSLSMPVKEEKAQAVGSAITYARRYSLQAFVGIAPEDDDGAEARDNPPSDEPREGTRKIIPPKGNTPKPESKPPREPPPDKRKPAADHGENQKVSDALDDYLEASGDKRTKRVILAEALGKPWPSEPSEMDRLTVIGMLNQKATKAEGKPDPYVPSDGKGDSLPAGES